uniref:Ubiquitin-like protease family profile domain-containing protein n=1 Tax=Oryza barthii TaxID=65489 RepID=A0A0D3GPP7_9ORYZ
MVHAKDSDEIFVDSTSSDSESSENDDVISDSEDSKTSCDEISKEELLRSLKLKLNKKKVSVDCNLKLDSALLEIFRDNVLIEKSVMTDATEETKLTRFSVKYFSEVLEKLSKRHRDIISKSCFKTLLLFEKCSVPSRLALWIAQKVDVNSCDIIVRDKVIPLSKESVHIVLGLPVGGLPISSNSEIGKQKILDTFGLSSLPTIKFFGDKLIRNKSMSDDQVLISFMMVSLNCFLCPNSSLQPSTKYLSAFADLTSIDKLDWSNLVFEWLMKHLSKLEKSKSFGGCLYYRVVNYLDFLNFGMRKVLQDTPRIKIESGTAKATFLQRLDSAIGVDLPQEIKKDINELLLHHLGPDENCIDDRVKNLLIDIFVLLSNASKPSVPDNTDDKNKLNDGSIINEANICETPKIHSTCDDNAILNEQSPMLCKDTKTPERSCSEKDKNSDVDGIMRKLCKPGMISSPPKITKARFVGFNERKSIFLGHEKPSFKIWDSDDNLRSEVTPRHGLKSSKIVPDSYSPACPTELNKTKIIPLDLSQNLYDLSQNQENNSGNELIMVSLEDSETQSQHNEKENLPVQQQYTKSTENKKDSLEAVFLGERQSTENCLDITSKTNVLYNKINTFIVNPDKKLKMCTASPKRVLLCNVDRNVGQCSSSQKPQHDLRRILQPARYSTGPYSPERQSFCVTAYDRQVYNAVCKISKSSFQDKVAVDIDGVHCKFFTFGDSFKPSGELSNFVTSVFCRYMFRLSHPSKSKKHYFFSSIGDDLLRERSTTNFSVVKKYFDGASLARPVHSCDLLFFPIVKNRHWSVFAIDLKAQRFVFLDSMYDEDSICHQQIRPKLISNFSLAWNLYVKDHPIDFNNYTVIYPPVPKQTNRFDYGIFTLKFMEVWGPRVLLPNIFSQRDIPNIRIQLLNKMLFHPHNSILCSDLYKLPSSLLLHSEFRSFERGTVYNNGQKNKIQDQDTDPDSKQQDISKEESKGALTC